MNPHELTQAEVEQALRARYARLAALRDECPELSLVCAAVHGELPPEEERHALAHARTCPCCGDALSAEPERTRPWWAWPAGGLSLAAACVLLAVWTGSPHVVWTPPELVPSLRSKGAPAGGDRLSIAARRGTERWIHAAGGALREGDLIGMFYSTDRAGHLMVVHLDEALAPTVLYPARGQHSAPIEPGDDVALADSAVITDAQGCAWFVGIFSEQPVSLAAVRRSLASARTEGACDLQLSVANSRSVDIIAVRRAEGP